MCLIWFRSRNVSGDSFGFVLGEGDEPGLDRRDFSGQLGWIRDLEQGGKLGGFLRGNDAGIDDALVGSAWFVVNASLLAMLVRAPVDSFCCCGKQTQPHPHQRLELVQQLQLERVVVAVVERMTAHHIAVLLLDMGVMGLLKVLLTSAQTAAGMVMRSVWYP
jgi:hypothetical protein